MGVGKSKQQQVCEIIHNDNIVAMNNILIKYPELLSLGYDNNLLRFAIEQNATPRMIYLLLGAKTTFETAPRHSIIHAALLHKDPTILKIILAALPKEYIDIRMQDNSTIFLALLKKRPHLVDEYHQHMDILLQYAKQTIDINIPDDDNNTPILWAAVNGHKKIVESILKCDDVDIDSHHYNGYNARWWILANSLGNVSRRPKYIRRFDGEELFTALREECEHKFIELLKSRSCDINVEDGSTLLQLACKHNLVSAVGALLDAGVDINKTTIHEPRTPIEIAVERGFNNVATQLVIPRPHVSTHEIICPALLIHKALSTHHTDSLTLQVLLTALEQKYIHINLNEQDVHGRNTLECAYYWGQPKEVQEKLIKLGAIKRWRFSCNLFY